jgi:hypothetical protein
VRMTWERLGDLSVKLELWETALVVELMKVRLIALKESKIQMLNYMGLMIEDDDNLITKMEYNEILSESVDTIFKKTEKIFRVKNKIIMLALNLNQL